MKFDEYDKAKEGDLKTLEIFNYLFGEKTLSYAKTLNIICGPL
jgi:hypothetical protein